MQKIGILLCVGVLLAAPAGAQNTADEVVTIPTRDGVTVPFPRLLGHDLRLPSDHVNPDPTGARARG